MICCKIWYLYGLQKPLCKLWSAADSDRYVDYKGRCGTCDLQKYFDTFHFDWRKQLEKRAFQANLDQCSYASYCHLLLDLRNGITGLLVALHARRYCTDPSQLWNCIKCVWDLRPYNTITLNRAWYPFHGRDLHMLAKQNRTASVLEI